MVPDVPSTKTEYAHIVRTPDILGGEPRITGHRIRVRDIAAARDLGAFTPEEIAANLYPSLTLAQVYAALAYYEDHREDIACSEEAERQFVEDFVQRHPRLVHGDSREKG
jgi:uncharacterized protein (DUF433 family)